MGVHPNIGYRKFPTQGKYLNARVGVCFNYDASKAIMGKVIRDDREEPFLTIILLDETFSVKPAPKSVGGPS